MKIYIFRCFNKSDLFAVSVKPTSDTLPGGICAGGWEPHSEAEVKPGDLIAGFVTRDLFRDLERQGFHLASGVRVTASPYEVAVSTAVSGAISTANTRTRFFKTDTDA
jgi:hypothetical protein